MSVLQRCSHIVRVLLVVAALLQAPGALAADWLYTVRPGDKLWVLADKFCGTHARWRDLAAHNQLDQPTRLQVGSQIRFPLAWLIEEAAAVRVVYTRGDVTIESSGAAGSSGAQSATQGAQLGVGAKLVTGADSSANVQFADGSSLQIGPESEVVFDTLSAYRDTGMVDSRIRINRGSGSSAVKPQGGPGSVYRISTPLGVAAVRGTEFRTRSVGDASFVETIGGSVEFIAPTGSSAVERGYGLKADPQGITVEELLAAPQLAAPRTSGGNDTIEWTALAGATSYVVKIYTGPDLDEVLTTAAVTKLQYVLPTPPGSYSVGVSGVAVSGLMGFETTQTLIAEATTTEYTVAIVPTSADTELLLQDLDLDSSQQSVQ